MDIFSRIEWIIKNLEGGIQLDFAKKIGVSASAVNKWLDKEKPQTPRLDALLEIRSKYGLTHAWLFDGIGEPFEIPRKSVVSANPSLKNQATEGEAGYGGQAEQINAAGREIEPRIYEPADPTARAIEALITVLKESAKNARENKELRRKIRDQERRLAALEGDLARRGAGEKTGSD